MKARRTSVEVIYQGVDISKDIKKDLLNFTYTDNASGNADDISISIKDEKAKWLNSWSPQKGDDVKAQIYTTNWRFDGDKQQLPCGSFIIDEPAYAGRPRVISINAISTPANGNFSTTKRNKAWEAIKLKDIAQDIADRSGLKLFFDSKNSLGFDRVDQTDTSDATFLADICTKKGLAFKVTDKSIIIFDEKEYESKPVVATYSEGSSLVKGYNLKTTLTDTAYAGCIISYFDSSIGKKIEYLYAPKDDIDPKKDKVYRLNSRVKNGQEAKESAMKMLRQLNKNEWQVSMTVAGNIDLVGGSCIQLKDFGAFSGKYYIDKATHNLPGYMVNLELHKVLEGY